MIEYEVTETDMVIVTAVDCCTVEALLYQIS